MTNSCTKDDVKFELPKVSVYSGDSGSLGVYSLDSGRRGGPPTSPLKSRLQEESNK